MRKRIPCIFIKAILLTLMLCNTLFINAQTDTNFWDRVRFGGSLGAAFGTGYTDVMLAPNAIYQFNQYFGAGVGLQGSYVNLKDRYTSYIYGASIIGIANPIREIQLSAELEQLRVNLNFDDNFFATNAVSATDRDFWNTALFIGAGYNTGNITVGLRYNILFRERDLVYNDALIPFVRVLF